LLGISIFCLLLVRNSESFSDDGIAPRICSVILSSWCISVCFLTGSEKFGLCCVCSRCVYSICASCVQESHLRGPSVQAVGLELQGQGSLHMVRCRVLGVQQPRGYSVRTTNSSLSFEPLDAFSLFFSCNLL
jgi:hypothetical protein